MRNKQYHIVILKPPIETEPETLQKTRKQGKSLCSVSSLVAPALVGVSEDGRAALAFERTEAKSWAELLHTKKTLTLAAVQSIIQAVSEALEPAYQKGFFHGGLTLFSIVLPGHLGSDPKILDFGVSYLGRSSRPYAPEQVLGAWPYLAPEIWKEPAAIDARTDVYALAVCAYRALTGQFPFVAKDATGFMAAHTLSQMPRISEKYPHVPQWAEDVLRKALSKSKEDRYETPAEFAQKLMQVITEGATLPKRTPVMHEEKTRQIEQTEIIDRVPKIEVVKISHKQSNIKSKQLTTNHAEQSVLLFKVIVGLLFITLFIIVLFLR